MTAARHLLESETGMQRSIPKIAVRLSGAFGAILALFAAALVVTLQTLDRLAEADAEVATLEDAKHAGHAAAALVREQYIHQAHTIINWDDSHLAHYADVERQTRAATHRLRQVASTTDERQLADEIARLAAQIDTEFRETILPAIRSNQRGNISALHGGMEVQVNRVVRLNEELNRSLEHRSNEARQRKAELRARARMVEIVCFALAIALACVVGFFIARSILRPVAQLRSGANQLAQGDLTTRIAVNGSDEFSELAAAFNHMAKRLSEHQEELVRSQKLAAIGHVAAGVAHEINNPLGVILGYTKLMKREIAEDAPLHHELSIIEDEARQCQRIVEGLLDLARPKSLELATVDLTDLATDAIERLEEAGKLDSVRVERPSAVSSPVASGDEAKLRQVISNLLVNAVEATPENGTVTVAVDTDGDDVTLTVSDTGSGVPSDLAEKIFDPFFTTKAKGTGLGLPISQAIMEAHGGRLTIESAPGRGTRAIVSLPCAAHRRERET